jgi:BirA family transcriptional regulator, biotin operon repressor / biotin---[acetyl-CoA-carboxylase] ligase
MPQSAFLFTMLDEVDSTNNYAMAKITQGLAQHGQAWFAKMQTAGKGQRGKTWLTDAGKNVILSVCVNPKGIFYKNPYLLSALAATSVAEVVQSFTNSKVFVKWPNDVYIDDRKAGGILIENQYKGKDWAWAVIGIGINVNQTEFGELVHATSLKKLTHTDFNVVEIAQQIQNTFLQYFEAEYNAAKKLNALLYKKDEVVKLKKDNASFYTKIKYVNNVGELVTEDAIERTFTVGEVLFVVE